MSMTHVFFDLDGTLVDSLPGITYSARAAVEQVYSGRTLPDLLPFIGPPIREVFRRALPENDSKILERLEQSFRTSYDSEGWRKTRAYPGVKKVLAQVCESGFVCCVLTNKPHRPTHTILRHLCLGRFFTEVITPDTRTPCYSSKVEAALDIQRRNALAGEDALLVGDSADDGAAAEACGFKFAAATFGYGRAYRECDSPVHFRLEQFEDLLNLLWINHCPTR
jgi:phosphoglycolate phosphatase